MSTGNARAASLLSEDHAAVAHDPALSVEDTRRPPRPHPRRLFFSQRAVRNALRFLFVILSTVLVVGGLADWQTRHDPRVADTLPPPAPHAADGPHLPALWPGDHFLNESVAHPLYDAYCRRRPSPCAARPPPVWQRYALRGLVPGRRYYAQVSYPGSPSVSYELRLATMDAPPGGGGGGHRAMDTETRLISVAGDHDGRLEFAAGEHVFYREAGEGDAAPPLLVLEVRATVKGLIAHPERFPAVYYNLHLSELLLGVVPAAVLPLALSLGLALDAGLLLLLPILWSALDEGGEDETGDSDGDSKWE